MGNAIGVTALFQSSDSIIFDFVGCDQQFPALAKKDAVCLAKPLCRLGALLAHSRLRASCSIINTSMDYAAIVPGLVHPRLRLFFNNQDFCIWRSIL